MNVGVRTPAAALALAVLLLAAGCAAPRAAPPRAVAPDLVSGAASAPDDYVQRLEALAILQTLNADLLSHDSATLTLDRWCASHRLAEPAKVVAERDRAITKPPTPELRSLLAVSADEPLRYRRVQLRCGRHVLSEADNWYVPSRLTAEMNAALDTSDVAFGRAVQALRFQRQTLDAQLLWSPLPAGWDMTPRPPPQPAQLPVVPPHVLRHTAVLRLPDGRPISVVVESYTAAVLAFLEGR